MEFTFIDMAGKTLFVRNDAERANWTVEEMTLDLEFPYLPNKHISTGQRIVFHAPTGELQIYEVKQAKTLEPDNYQQIVAENICISELSDEHINESIIENKNIRNALATVLDGTLWQIGNVKVNPTSSVDISRGCVWQAVLQIQDNWNVYITPRVTLSGDGTISRYLDVTDTKGTFNGIRLSIDKNFLDPSVTYDDSEVYTALYGYGGTDTSVKDSKEIDFSSVAWSKTSDHPAKPKGQKYLEDPAATLAYGRNGRARFGFYQNTDILDPEILLQKTWETLQTVSKPKISIEGTVADLHRLGYSDTPLRLHDIAFVEVLPIGYKAQIQIIRYTIDLLDPSNSTLTIGAYIPNIIYIQKKTNQSATGSRGGGGGNTSDESTFRQFETTIDAYKDGTGMQIRAVENSLTETNEKVAIQEGKIEVTYEKVEQEVIDRRNSDNVLSGRITVTAGKIEQVVSAVGKNGEVTAASILLAINDDSTSSITLDADRIDINGLITALSSRSVAVGTLHVEGRSDFLQSAYFEAGLNSDESILADGYKVHGNSNTATWQTAQVYNLTFSNKHNYVYVENGGQYNVSGYIILSKSESTIHYLGY